MNELTYLYRQFNSAGTLLYVGISNSHTRRTSQHFQSGRWETEIAKVTVSSFSCREEALAEEKRAIISERPKYNIQHNEGRQLPYSPIKNIPLESYDSYFEDFAEKKRALANKRQITPRPELIRREGFKGISKITRQP